MINEEAQKKMQDKLRQVFRETDKREDVSVVVYDERERIITKVNITNYDVSENEISIVIPDTVERGRFKIALEKEDPVLVAPYSVIEYLGPGDELYLPVVTAEDLTLTI